MEFENILHQNNWPIKSANSVNLKDIEDKIGFTLPNDYSYFLNNFKSFETSIGEQYINLWDSENLLSLNEDYEIFDYLKYTVGIGSNGGGELIALEKLEDSKYRIILTPLIDLDCENHLQIGTSFSNFIERLEAGKEWFES